MCPLEAAYPTALVRSVVRMVAGALVVGVPLARPARPLVNVVLAGVLVRVRGNNVVATAVASRVVSALLVQVARSLVNAWLCPAVHRIA